MVDDEIVDLKERDDILRDSIGLSENAAATR
jgi:hypothetical protein